MPKKVKLVATADDSSSSDDSTDVSKVSKELSSCRSRLEAGVEDNKRNREVIQGLSDQIQKYRQRAAEKDALIAGSRMSHHRSLSRLDQPSGSLYSPSPYHGQPAPSEASLHADANGFRVSPMHRSSPLLNRSFEQLDRGDTININIDQGLYGGHLDLADAREMETIFNKLKAELFKNNTLEEINDMLRSENDAALAANLNLRADVGELTRALDQLSREHRDEQERFRIENQRYRTYLDSQHKQLITLWKAFLAVKKQVRELKAETAHEMDKQMTEFVRCANLMQRALRQTESKTNMAQSQMTKEKDDVLEEILQKYESLAAKNLTVEQENSEKTRSLMRLESSLRREREEKETATQTLVKICQMPELNHTSTRQRHRSASPGSAMNTIDAVRKIRSALGAKTQEIRDLQMKVERVENHSERLQRDIEKLEREQKAKDEERKQREEEDKQREQSQSEIERQARRLEERVQTAEQEKEKIQETVHKLQESIAGIHRSHKEFIEQLTTRHKEELGSRQTIQEAESQRVVDEEKLKSTKARDDLDKLRLETEKLRQQLRELNADMQSTKKALEEKDASQSTLEEEVSRLKDQLIDAQNSIDERDKDLEAAKSKLEHSDEKRRKLKHDLVESNGVNEILQDDNRSLQEQCSEMREQLAEMQTRLDQATATEEEMNRQVSQLNDALDTHERTIKDQKGALENAAAKYDNNMEELVETRERLNHHKEALQQKIAEVSTIIEKKEEMSREKEALADDLNTSSHEVAALNAKCASLEKEISDRLEQENQLKIFLDEMRASVDKSQREMAEKNAIIEDMKDKLEELHNDLLRKEQGSKEEIQRVQQTRAAEMQSEREEWAYKVQSAELEKESLKKSLIEVENRNKEVTVIYDNLKKEEEKLQLELEELKDKLDSQEKKYRKEMEHLIEQNNADREEWELEREQEEKSKQTWMKEMTEELRKAEGDIRDGLIREDGLKRDLEDLKEAVDQERRRAEAHKNELETQGSSLAQLEQSSLLEKQQLITQRPRYIIEQITHHIQVEETEVRYTKVQTQCEELVRKRTQLENDINKMEALLAKKSQLIHDYEIQLDELGDRIAEGEGREHRLRDDIALLEREVSELQNYKERKELQIMEDQRKISEMEQRIRELQKDVHSHSLKVQTTSETVLDKNEEIQALTNKVQQLDLQLADKNAKLESTSELLKKLEGAEKTMMTELKQDAEKVTHYRRQNEDLKSQNQKLKEELSSMKAALDKKTNTSRTAMADLVDNYREAERQSQERQTECDHLKAHISSLNAKLDRMDRKKTDLENRLDDADSRAGEMAVRLNQYERSATMALNLSKGGLSLRPGTSNVDLTHQDHYSSFNSGLGSYGNMRTSASSHDVSASGSASPDRSVHFDDANPKLRGLNMSSSMDITLRYLKERIEQLEKDKADLTAHLQEMKSSNKKNASKVEETTSVIQKLERKVNELTDENKLLDSRLNSQRQLYLSNEETMRSKDHEHRSLKAKLVSADLHLREKESKINAISSQLETLRLELAEVNADKQKYSTLSASMEEEMKHVEDERHQIDEERNQLQMQLKSAQQDLKSITKRMEELESQGEAQKKTMAEMKKSSTKDRELIERLQNEEKHWRQTAVAARKTQEEYQKNIYEERMSNMQHNHDTLTAKYEQLQMESDKLRQELREANQRTNLANNKLAEMEHRLDDVNQQRKTANQQVQALQKLETEWLRQEREMREELKQLRKDKLSMTAEMDEMKRRIVRSDIERKEIEAVRARLDREVAALKKHVDALESDKSRTDEAVRNTLAERKAMDKSLAAMEKENTELYRNCSQLQTQNKNFYFVIQQLERDTGTRSVTKMLKENADLEARISKLIQEKRQLEMVLEQKDMNFGHKRKMLESQLGLLKEQLESERRRRIEANKRDPRATPDQPGQSIHHSNYSSFQRTRSISRQKSPFRV